MSPAAAPIWQDLPPAWQDLWYTPDLAPVWQALDQFLQSEWQTQTLYPPRDDLFTALKLTAPEQVRVLLLGQDPYHQPGQAHGLSFSVPPGVPLPPSLRNIFVELQDDLGYRVPATGCLIPWAQQGVLLLNAVLSVRAGQAASHARQGWEILTDALIERLSQQSEFLVCLLWGRFAQAKRPLLAARHVVLHSAHPSPLSAHRGFWGSRPFSQINAALMAAEREPIDWELSKD